MYKKIIGWTLLAGLIVLLTVGAVNRTLAKTDEHSGGNTTQNGHSEPRSQNQNELAQGGGQRFGQGSDHNNQNTQYNPGVAQAGDLELFTVEGVVLSLDATALVISLDGQETFEIANRAWMFAQEQGYYPQPGDLLRLTGFFEAEDHFEVSRIENLTTGDTILLREDSGRPMWAGGSRGG